MVREYSISARKPTKDARIAGDSNVAGTNYGSDTFLSAGYRGNGEHVSLIHFDVSDIPTGAIIMSSYLKMTLYPSTYSDSNTTTIHVGRVTSNWSESTVTYNNRPSWTGTYASTSISGTTGTANFYFADLVQAWVNGTYTNYGIALRRSDSYTKYFYSKEYGTTSARPSLYITYRIPALDVNINNSWRQSKQVFVDVSGSWKKAQAMYVNIGGSWARLL